MNIRLSIVLFLFSMPISMVIAQENSLEERKNRFGIIIGHSHYPAGEQVDNGHAFLLVPTWGLEIERDLAKRYSLGLKAEVEVANYILYKDQTSQLSRKYPLTIYLSNTFMFSSLGVVLNVGIEFEQDEHIPVFSILFEYEFRVSERWDVTPELGFAIKDMTYGGVSFGVNIGRRF